MSDHYREPAVEHLSKRTGLPLDSSKSQDPLRIYESQVWAHVLERIMSKHRHRNQNTRDLLQADQQMSLLSYPFLILFHIPL